MFWLVFFVKVRLSNMHSLEIVRNMSVNIFTGSHSYITAGVARLRRITVFELLPGNGSLRYMNTQRKSWLSCERTAMLYRYELPELGKVNNCVALSYMRAWMKRNAPDNKRKQICIYASNIFHIFSRTCMP